MSSADGAMAAVLRRKGRQFLTKEDRSLIYQMEVEAVPDNQPQNPFSEIQILTNHSNVIRDIIHIDRDKFVSVSDDNTAIIWSFYSACPLHILHGHTKPVVCATVITQVLIDESGGYPIEDQILLTGSLDKTILVWNLETGQCLQHFKDLFSYVKVLSPCFTENLFIAGGADLHLWSLDGTLYHTVVRQGEDVTHILPICDDRIVVAANNSLEVFSIVCLSEHSKELERIKPLAPNHKEMILNLQDVTDQMFLSSSLDGAIKLWNKKSLTTLRELNCYKEYYLDNRYPYCVHHTCVVDDTLLFAAVGEGLALFNINGECLWRKERAHHSKILHICLVYNSSLLASCSEDGTIRLWGSMTKQKIAPTEGSSLLSNSIESTFERLTGRELPPKPKRSVIRKEKNQPPLLSLQGECMAHSGAVQKVLNFEEDGMVSFGADGVIVIWKDGENESARRDEQLRKMFNLSKSNTSGGDSSC